MVGELEIKITWENNNFFKMEKKVGSEPWLTVVEIEENAHIAAIAGNLQGLCMADFNAHLDDIMTEMRVP
ncbi:hypothetical protein LCGC14_2108210 [marine sediment metagenome]|uniref:Uncharacterized protein n=1 Tax=marine sediment metagenome TaxID=412755 RepID=A0A0F9EUZ5_9ZZZZ